MLESAWLQFLWPGVNQQLVLRTLLHYSRQENRGEMTVPALLTALLRRIHVEMMPLPHAKSIFPLLGDRCQATQEVIQ